MKRSHWQLSRSIAFFFALALSIIWAPSSDARTTVIDDSGTTTLEPTVRLRWSSVAPPRRGANNQMVGLTTVRVHLNLLPWLKRSGRIYLALPAQPPGPLTATWTAAGRLAAGQAHSGTRTLLYSGPVTAPFLDDVLRFQFAVDGSVVRRPFPVTFRFEFDED